LILENFPIDYHNSIPRLNGKTLVENPTTIMDEENMKFISAGSSSWKLYIYNLWIIFLDFQHFLITFKFVFIIFSSFSKTDWNALALIGFVINPSYESNKLQTVIGTVNSRSLVKITALLTLVKSQHRPFSFIFPGHRKI